MKNYFLQGRSIISPSGSLIYTFGYAAGYGHISLVKKIIDLVKKIDTTSTATSDDKQKSLKEENASYQRQLGLPPNASALAILLMGKTQSSSNLSRAMSSGDQEVIDLIYKLLDEDPELLKAFGATLHKDCGLFNGRTRASMRRNKNEGYIIPESEEDFLQALQEQVENQKKFVEILSKIFSMLTKPPKPKALSTYVEIIENLPEGYDQDCYAELRQLLNLLDDMNQASGEGAEWARRLTILFNNVDQATAYIQSAIGWAMNHQNDRAIWKHRDLGIVYWPENLTKNHTPGYIPKVDALGAAMGFDFPSQAFKAEPWRQLLIDSPEAARYLDIAPEIEKHLTETSQGFPTTIAGLRSVVLEVDMQQCRLPAELKNKLINRLSGNKATETLESQEKRPMRSGLSFHATVSPEVKDFLRHLFVMGVLPSVATSIFGEELDEEYGGFVVCEEGKIRQSNYDNGEPTEEGAIRWNREEYQMVIPEDSPLEELTTFIEVLQTTQAISFLDEMSLRFDTEQMDLAEKFEFVKQLLIFVVRILPLEQVKENFIHYESPLRNKSDLTADEVVQAILSAENLEEIIVKYSGVRPQIRFRENYVDFDLKLAAIVSTEIVDTFNRVHEFADECLNIIKANRGKARDIASESLPEGHEKLLGYLGRK